MSIFTARKYLSFFDDDDRITVSVARELIDEFVTEAAKTAWDEGYMRGRYPWVSEDQTDDPIPSVESPPTRGRNINPYRAALKRKH